MTSGVGRSSAGQRGPHPEKNRGLLRAGAGSFFAWPLLVLALLANACARPAATDPSGQAAQSDNPVPIVRTLAPAGLGGSEICFNATDDNDNTLIDEGCDVRQGDVHFMVSWPDPAIDVDLLVVDPSGSLAGTSAPSVEGLVLSDDCPRAGGACNGQAFESVHLDDEDVPTGTYRVRVVVVDGPTRLVKPLVVRFGARLPGISVAREVEFTDRARQVDFSFEVPAVKKAGAAAP